MSKRIKTIGKDIQSVEEIDTLSIMSKDLNSRQISPVLAKNHLLSLGNESNIQNQPIGDTSIQQTYYLKITPNIQNGESDMSMLVIQGLEIARRKSRRQQQICSILPRYQCNNNILRTQITELTSMTQLQLLMFQQSETTATIKALEYQISSLKRENNLKQGIKTGSNGRRYLSPNFGLVNKGGSQHKKNNMRIQQINFEMKRKNQQFLKNKIKYQQLAWQLEKIQRRCRMQNLPSRQQTIVRTVSKKKRQHYNDISNTRQVFRPTERSKESSNRKIKGNIQTNSGLSSKYTTKMNQQYYCNDKSDFKGANSSYTQQKTKKQLLFRRLKIVNQSITLYQGTFSKMISQLQLECKILSKQLDCVDDEISNSNTVDGSSVNIQQQRSANGLNANRYPPVQYPEIIFDKEQKQGPRGQSQNLRTLVNKKQRKLSTHFGNGRQSSATCRKIRVSSAYQIDSDDNKSSKLRKMKSNKYISKNYKGSKKSSQFRNLTPDTIKQSYQKQQNMVMEQYFQIEQYDEKVNNGRQSYSPQIIRKYY